MSQPVRISVIVPVHNAEHTLDACVDSLLTQTCLPCEIWLIENGSADASAARCRAWEQRDARVRHISLSQTGVSRARNVGLEHASGTHITFVDADDTLPPQALAQLGSQADAADWVWGAYRRGQGGPVIRQDGDQLRRLAQADVAEYILSHRMELLVGSVWAKLYRADLARRCRFPEEIHFAEDNLFNLAYAALAQHTVLLPAVVYTYMPQPVSLASRILPHLGAISCIQEARLTYARSTKVRNGEARVYGCTVNMLLRALNEQAAIGSMRAFGAFADGLMGDEALRTAVAGHSSETVSYRYGTIASKLLRGHHYVSLYLLLRLKQKMKHK